MRLRFTVNRDFKVILHLINSFHAGGAETLTCRSAPLFLQWGYRPVVVSLSKTVDQVGQCLIGELDEAGIPWHSVAKPVRSGRLRAIIRCANLIQHYRPHIVHTHCSSPDFYGGMGSAFVGGAKHVSTLHSTRYDSRWFAKVARRISQPLSKPHYIAISSSVAAVMEEQFGISSKRMDIVPNGVDERRFTGEFDRDRIRREVLGVGSGRQVIVSVGRLAQPKNFPCLIDAFALLLGERPDLSLAIFGEGEERQRLETRIEDLGIGQRVSLPGVVTHVPAILRSADLFVLPSAWEGFGLAAVEAMMAGLPVIVSDVDGLREMANRGAPILTFPSGDVRSLADRMKQFLDSPKLMSRLGQAAKAWAIQNYSLKAMVEGYVSVYDKLLDS